jgi:uncharacterized membrane protein YczE
VSGVVLNAVATGLYIGARFGPGPRDGLMTGLAARGHRSGWSGRASSSRCSSRGALLGGTVGVGTLVYALSIGPLAHVLVPALMVPGDGRRASGARDPAA